MDTQDQKEEITKESPQETPQESPKEQPQQISSGVSEDLLNKMVNLCERQSETIIELNNRLNEMEENHKNLKKDVENNKNINITASVVGTFDFNTMKEEMLIDNYMEEKQYARKLDDAIKAKYRRI